MPDPLAGFHGLLGAASADITPPVGIYARSWGAAEHDAAEGVHRPLTLSALTLRQEAGGAPLALLSADLGWWRDPAEERAFRDRLLDACALDPARLVVAFTHTHAGPALSVAEASKPGGHWIAPYLKRLTETAIAAIQRARATERPGVLEWSYGRCQVAANRDLPDPETPGRFVAGWNPQARADDTLLVGRATAADGTPIASLVNYACHPTVLAWQNRLLSPDFIGALREEVQRVHPGPCLFLQGASGELAPREQYTADTAVADRHGQAIGLAAAAALQTMPASGTRLAFERVVESGAPLALWSRAPASYPSHLDALCVPVELPIKPEWRGESAQERQWAAAGDTASLERLARRQRLRRALGGQATATISLWAWRIGDALLFAHPNEAYSLFQTSLRERFAGTAVAAVNVANGWHGYLPPAALYIHDLYPVWCSPFDRGGLETLIEAAGRAGDTLRG